MDFLARSKAQCGSRSCLIGSNLRIAIKAVALLHQARDLPCVAEHDCDPILCHLIDALAAARLGELAHSILCPVLRRACVFRGKDVFVAVVLSGAISLKTDAKKLWIAFETDVRLVRKETSMQLLTGCTSTVV